MNQTLKISLFINHALQTLGNLEKKQFSLILLIFKRSFITVIVFKVSQGPKNAKIDYFQPKALVSRGHETNYIIFISWNTHLETYHREQHICSVTITYNSKLGGCISFLIFLLESQCHLTTL